jgi:drug/metabolite transporter (DMT)-like permease
MIAILVFYFVQILIAIYIFVNQGELAVYGNIFIVFYSIMMVLMGVFFFKEQLTLLQGVGIILALSGALLLNSGAH